MIFLFRLVGHVIVFGNSRLLYIRVSSTKKWLNMVNSWVFHCHGAWSSVKEMSHAERHGMTDLVPKITGSSVTATSPKFNSDSTPEKWMLGKLQYLFLIGKVTLQGANWCQLQECKPTAANRPSLKSTAIWHPKISRFLKLSGCFPPTFTGRLGIFVPKFLILRPKMVPEKNPRASHPIFCWNMRNSFPFPQWAASLNHLKCQIV